MDDVDRMLDGVWRRAVSAEVVAAEQEVAGLHDLARRVEAGFGVPAGRLLREAADLVAEAAEEMRRIQLGDDAEAR